jgi:diaminopimelate epimerase
MVEGEDEAAGDVPIPFVKGHGLGNDYLVVHAADLPGGALEPAAAVALCDRHRGVGADGVLLHVASDRADAGVRIVNPDGSEAEKSGNGLRIFVKYLWDHGHVRRPTFTVETAGGVVTCECRVEDGRVDVVVVEMGHATFAAGAIPMRGVDGEAVEVPLVLPNDESLVVTAVSVGNPHCVVFVDAPSEARCRALGPLLERHSAFPRRTNVQLVRALDRATLAMHVWERGAGYTLASGSSSCAAAAAAVRTGRADPGPIRVDMPGGALVVHVRADWSLRLEGPVALTYAGTLAPSFAAALFTASPAPPTRPTRGGRRGS